MKNKNLHKNQPHAQALTDDDLENVAGGMEVITNYKFKLSGSEILKINAAGFYISPSGEDNTFYVLSPSFKPLSEFTVQRILDGKLNLHDM